MQSDPHQAAQHQKWHHQLMTKENTRLWKMAKYSVNQEMVFPVLQLYPREIAHLQERRHQRMAKAHNHHQRMATYPVNQ
jgi:hypothetical protein